ncbi:MAG: hypothetical protein IPM48_14380 [Saprospiraceae bacterium]|nr:hypothetical protein [Saprospiraceae bacterium]
MSIQQRYNKAKTLLHELKELQEIKNRVYFVEGRILNELFSNALYKELFGGEKYEAIKPSWKRFTEEITGMPTSTADQKRKNYQKWVVELGFSENDLKGVTFTKLYLMIPYATDIDTANELLTYVRQTDSGDDKQDVQTFAKFLNENYEKSPSE